MTEVTATILKFQLINDTGKWFATDLVRTANPGSQSSLIPCQSCISELLERIILLTRQVKILQVNYSYFYFFV